MKKIIILYIGIISFALNAQKIKLLDLPSFFEREFEISGLTGNENYLFLAAERCEKIFIIKKDDMTHVETIQFNSKDIPNGIEIEGLCLFKDFLLLTDEKNGKIVSFNRNTEKLLALHPNGIDLSSFKGKYGIEGIAVDEKLKVLYVLREKNAKHQSEIHSFSISKKKDSLILKYRNKTLVQHVDAKWRYTGLSMDYENNRLLCLKSYYLKNQPNLCKREIDYISIDSLSNKQTNPNMLLSLTKEIYRNRNSFATNIEGIYSDNESIFVTSDNGEGKKDCSQKSIKTILIKVQKHSD